MCKYYNLIEKRHANQAGQVGHSRQRELHVVDQEHVCPRQRGGRRPVSAPAVCARFHARGRAESRHLVVSRARRGKDAVGNCHCRGRGGREGRDRGLVAGVFKRQFRGRGQGQPGEEEIRADQLRQLYKGRVGQPVV